MPILNKIISDKKKEITLRKKQASETQLKNFHYYTSPCRSVVEAFEQQPKNIIVEIKPKSTNKADKPKEINFKKKVLSYEKAGASAVSICTHQETNNNKLVYLQEAKQVLSIPIIQKDLIFESYQVHEAKAYGADCIRLIAKFLSISEIQQLSTLAQNLGMEVLVEVHAAEELVKTNFTSINLIGVNNQNSETAEINNNNSLEIAGQIPPEFVKISENNIYQKDQIDQIYNFGFEGFTIANNLLHTEYILEIVKNLSNKTDHY